MSDPDDTPTPEAPASEQQALQDALAGLLSSLARLGVDRGLPCAEVEAMLREAYVDAAAAAHPGLPENRRVSRISTTTGIHRREVARLVQRQAPQGRAAAAPRGRSLASELFTHWRTQPPFRGPDGQPRVLPRQGPAPSFEALAQGITRNVHPRSLLDEMCRLGVARWDALDDTVALTRETFVAGGDVARQLGFLGDNVGDHLRAAVANVIDGDDRLHFEQAVFADGLSAASLASVRPAVRAQWQALLQALVPALEERVAADAQLDPPPQGRLRVGLYTYHEAGAAPPRASAAPAPAARARFGRKTPGKT